MQDENFPNSRQVVSRMLKLVRYAVMSAVVIGALGGAACSKEAQPFVDPAGRDTVLTDPREQYIPPTGSATTSPTMKVTSARGMQYWISVPKGWPGTRTWPVVMALSGASKDFENHAKYFARLRDEANLPFIVVTPVLLTVSGDNALPRDHPAYNYPPATWDIIEREGRCMFDIGGMHDVMVEVRNKFAGQSKDFFTGFSGGGNPTWAMILLKPELMRAAAPVASNYGGRCVTSENLANLPISHAPERLLLPVRTFNGANDTFLQMGTAQQETAMNLARANGFTNFSTTVVPNVAHDPMPGLVMSYFYSLLSATER